MTTTHAAEALHTSWSDDESRTVLADGSVRYVRPATAGEASQHGAHVPTAQYVARTYYNGRMVEGPTFGRTRDELGAIGPEALPCGCVPHETHMSHFGTALYCETEGQPYCNFEHSCGMDD